MGELFYLRQFLGGAGQGWLDVAMLAFLFLVVIFKPERIYHRTLFGVAALLFALSIMVPPLVTVALGSFAEISPSAYGGPAGIPGGSPLLFSLANTFGPVLFGASVLCGLFALVPRNDHTSHPEPPKHPLE